MLIFTCERRELSEAISRASMGLPSRPGKPVLAGMLLTSEDKAVTLTASDGDMTFTAGSRAEIHSGGRVLLPGKMLSEVSKYFTGNAVTIDYQDGPAAEIIFGRSRITLSASEGKEYPAWGDPPAPHVSCGAGDLSAAIRSTVPAAGTTPPVLGSILVFGGGEKLALVATAGYQMAVTSLPAEIRTGDPPQVLIPVAAAERFARTISEGSAHLGWNDRTILLQAPGISVISRQVAGDYPRWDRVFGALPAGEGVSADVPELTAAVRMAALSAGERGVVSLAFSREGLRVAAAGQAGKSFSDVALSHHAGDFSLLLGTQALLDGLNGCVSTVSFAWTAPLKPFVMRSGDLTWMIQPRRELSINVEDT